MPKQSYNNKAECINANEQLVRQAASTPSENSNSFQALKPKGYESTVEIDLSFLESKEKPLSFLNKLAFLQHRKKIVHSIKALVKKHSLNNQTLFLSITYFDLICSKMSSFNELKLISKICLILAAKFADDGLKAYQLEKTYRSQLSSHYQSDEMFIVKLLDHNLNLLTPYDLLSQLLMCGVLFKNEVNDSKKIDLMYNTVIKVALMFIESNSYLELDQSQIAFGIVAFTRKLLGLEAYCPMIRRKYNIDSNDIISFKEGLSTVQEAFKVNQSKESIKHVDKKDCCISSNAVYCENKQGYEMKAVC